MLCITLRCLHSRYIFRWEFLLRVRDEHTRFPNHAIANGRNFNRPVSRCHFRFLCKRKAYYKFEELVSYLQITNRIKIQYFDISILSTFLSHLKTEERKIYFK